MCVAYALIVFVVCFHCSWRWVRLFIACYSLYVDCWMCRCLSFCFVTFVFIIVCVSNFSWCLIPPYIEALNKRHIHSQDDVMECLWIQFKLPAFACFSPNAPCRCCMGLWLDENLYVNTLRQRRCFALEYLLWYRICSRKCCRWNAGIDSSMSAGLQSACWEKHPRHWHSISQALANVQNGGGGPSTENKKSKVHSTILDIKCEHNAGCLIVKLLAALSPAGRTYPDVLPNHYRTSIHHCLFCSEPIERWNGIIGDFETSSNGSLFFGQHAEAKRKPAGTDCVGDWHCYRCASSPSTNQAKVLVDGFVHTWERQVLQALLNLQNPWVKARRRTRPLTSVARQFW